MNMIDRNDAYTVTSLDDSRKFMPSHCQRRHKETDHITEVGRASSGLAVW